MTEASLKQRVQRSIFVIVLLLITSGLAILALLLQYLTPFSSPTLQVGQVASQDILAPQDISYESEVLTEKERADAERSVPFIYTSPDTSVARQQLEHLRAALNFISSVRADTYATPEQKLADLSALENIHLNQETATRILALSDARWQAVQQESIVVLEQVMRGTIREDRLEEARRNIPTLVSLSLSEEQTAIVAEIVSAFVAPNSLYSENLTEAARQRAREAVEPVTRTYKAGETVVQRGQVLTSTDVEALQQLGLVQPQVSWKEIASAAALVLLVITFLSIYLRAKRSLASDLRGLTLLALLFSLFLLTARLVIPGHVLLPYIFPLAAYSLTAAVLFGADIALVSSLPLALLTAYGLPNALELTLYYTFTSLFGVLTLGRAQRISAFLWAGAVMTGSGAILTIIYRLPEATTDLLGLANLTGASVLYGIASASLTVLLQFVLAQFLGMTTALQLMEISRPDHPLLQLVLRNAPGTYQHSLQVANLAEQAAEYIDADTLLTRVGALYHDIGKALNPMFFIENQVPGSSNPHDDLDPLASSEIIIHHVTEGVELARKHRLPRRIQDFIREHHGTMITRYQYVKAVEAAGGDETRVDKERFRYPGPRPSSRETAILMLADGCEARVRAVRPKDAAELHDLIKDVIQKRIQMGQLDDTDLTLKDLDAIAESITATLRGIYHPRIEYPKLETSGEAEVTRPVNALPPTTEIPTQPHKDTPTAASSNPP